MNYSLQKNKVDFAQVICIFSLLYYAIGNFETQMLQQALWIFMPVSAICVFIKSKKVFANIYMKYLAALFIWSGFTALFAVDTEVAANSMTRMCGVFLFCYIIVYLSERYVSSYWVAIVYFVFFINCIIYAQTHILSLGDTIESDFRLTDEKLNANIFGYFLFIVTFLAYHLGIISRSGKIRLLFRVIFIALIPLTFFLAILTASRQILVLQAPYFSILLYRRYWKQAKVFPRIIFVSAFFALVFCFANEFDKIYKESYLAVRSEESITEDSRAVLAEEAFTVGIHNPILGVGPDNFKNMSEFHDFSHNTYLELFANSGIIAAVLYVIMLCKFLIYNYKKFRKYRTDEYFNYLWFGVFFIIDNVLYVFHLNSWLMGFFIFVASLSLNNTVSDMKASARRPSME